MRSFTLLMTCFLHANAVSGLIAELIVSVAGILTVVREDRYFLTARSSSRSTAIQSTA